MKNKFFGYYPLNDEEFTDLWNNCVFSFDTCVLLNLYRYSKNTSDELIKLLHSVSDRIWIPYQVGLEYHRNRLGVIYDQIPFYNVLINEIKKESDQLQETIYKIVGKGKHPLIDSEDIVKKFSLVCDETIALLEEKRKNHPDLLQNDTILEDLSDLLLDRVGDPYSDEKFREIIKDGKKRFIEKIPPGYQDSSDKPGDKQYGDLILWNQIIDYSTINEKPIIFVIDDRKEDWWLKKSGKTLGPRPELLQEFYLHTKNRIYIYSSDRFMKYAEEYLGEEVDKGSIDEVQKVREHDESLNSLTITSGSYIPNMDISREIRQAFEQISRTASQILSYSVKDNMNELAHTFSLMGGLASHAFSDDMVRLLNSQLNLRQAVVSDNYVKNNLIEAARVSSLGDIDEENQMDYDLYDHDGEEQNVDKEEGNEIDSDDSL